MNDNSMMNFGTEKLPFENQEQDKPGEYAAVWDGAMDDVPSFEEQTNLETINEATETATELSPSTQDTYNGGLQSEMVKAQKRENMFNRYDIADKVTALKVELVSIRPVLISLKTIASGNLLLETDVLNLDSYFKALENMNDEFDRIIESRDEIKLEAFVNVFENRLDGLAHQSRFITDRLRNNLKNLENEELSAQAEADCNSCDKTIDRVYDLLRASKDAKKTTTAEDGNYSAAPVLESEPEAPASVPASSPEVSSSADSSSPSEMSMYS